MIAAITTVSPITSITAITSIPAVAITVTVVIITGAPAFYPVENKGKIADLVVLHNVMRILQGGFIRYPGIDHEQADVRFFHQGQSIRDQPHGRRINDYVIIIFLAVADDL